MESKEKISVLIIDDDDVVLNALGQMVEKTGWKCLRAPSGEIGFLSAAAADRTIARKVPAIRISILNRITDERRAEFQSSTPK